MSAKGQEPRAAREATSHDKEWAEEQTLAAIGRRLLRRDALAAGMGARAGAVAVPGRFIGLFEWLVWSAMCSLRPKILVADHTMDLWE